MLRFYFLDCLYSRRCFKTLKYYTEEVLESNNKGFRELKELTKKNTFKEI